MRPVWHAQELRLHWLQGQIARGLGKVAEAVEILRLAREEYRARDLRREFALVTIDQAEAHVGQGVTATALRLLGETTPTEDARQEAQPRRASPRLPTRKARLRTVDLAGRPSLAEPRSRRGRRRCSPTVAGASG